MQNTSHILDITWRMMNEFASSASVTQSIQQGLEYVQYAISAEAASFFHLSEDAMHLTCTTCLGPVDISGQKIAANNGIIGTVTAQQKSRFVENVANAAEFDASLDAQSGFTTRSMICVPVAGKGHCYGAMQLINSTNGNQHFDKEDLALAELLATAAALALANARLTQNMLANESLRRNLNMAANVQARLLPHENDAQIYGRNIPRNTVSGDLFDFVRRDQKLYFCMGDVAGKGIDAALVMAKTHSLFRTISRNRPNPPQLMAAINTELLETAFEGMFVTLIIGTIDAASGLLQCCNAGHEPAFILGTSAVDTSAVDTSAVDANTVPHIEASVPPLAIAPLEADAIALYETILAPQARLYCYSDGISEAQFDGRALGTNGLRDLLEHNLDAPLKAQIDAALADIQMRADYVHDDLTLLGIKASA